MFVILTYALEQLPAEGDTSEQILQDRLDITGKWAKSAFVILTSSLRRCKPGRNRLSICKEGGQ